MKADRFAASFQSSTEIVFMKQRPSDSSSPIADAFAALHELARYLRSEHGCPWDRSQGLRSILTYLREETEELEEAIEKHDAGGVSEEWGDVLFIVLMFAVIAEETGQMEAERAMRAVEHKMIRRHPHVFGSSDVRNAEDILSQWQQIKKEEKNEKTQSLMDRLPFFYSALKRADYVQKTAAAAGFDWPDISGVLEKIEEEVREFREALAAGDTAETAKEIGDLLFSCVNLARYAGLDAETQLSRTVDKFIERFRYVESRLRRAGKPIDEATLEEMDKLWEESKTNENDSTG